MDGFNLEVAQWDPIIRKYVYVPHRESRPYLDMAHEWVLADRMFQSQLDESFVAHQYSSRRRPTRAWICPTGAWGCGGGKTDKVA